MGSILVMKDKMVYYAVNVIKVMTRIYTKKLEDFVDIAFLLEIKLYYLLL